MEGWKTPEDRQKQVAILSLLADLYRESVAKKQPNKAAAIKNCFDKYGTPSYQSSDCSTIFFADQPKKRGMIMRMSGYK